MEMKWAMHAGMLSHVAGAPIWQGLIYQQVRGASLWAAHDLFRRHVMAHMALQASAAGRPVTRPTCPSMLCMLCLFSALQGLLRKLGAGFEDMLPGMLGMGSGKMKVRGKRSGRRGGGSRIVSFWA